MYDGIVIGAGHNGMALAGYMARAGLSVAVVERNPHVGGGVTTSEVTLPGFKHNLHANFYVNLLNNPVVKDFELRRYGLKAILPDFQTGMVFRDGSAAVLHKDANITAGLFEKFSPKDARKYLELHEKFGVKLKSLIESIMYNAPLRPVELRERIKGKLGEEYLSYSQKSLYQAADETFEDEHVQMFFKLAFHTLAFDNDLGTGVFLPRLVSHITSCCLIVGGAENLALSLRRFLESHNAEIFTDCHVSKITIKDNTATGVVLENGKKLEAKKFVASAVDFPQTIRMAGEDNFDSGIVKKAREWKWAPQSLGTLHVALSKKPVYVEKGKDSHINDSWNVQFGVDNQEELDEMFDEVHAGRLPRRPAGNGATNSMFDPSYAPKGRHSAFWWPFVPYSVDGRGGAAWDDIKEDYSETLVDVWSTYAPNVKTSILKKYLYTPLDIERRNIDMVHGGQHAGAYTIDQTGFNRPHESLSHYRTPIAGLYLCGPSSYTGGSVKFSPGYNCANVLAADLGVRKWWTALPEVKWEEQNLTRPESLG